MAILGGDPPPPKEEEEEEENLEIRIFPNPTSNGELTIEMKKAGLYSVRIFDAQGRKVDDFMFEGIEHQFISKDTANGVYILEILDKEEVLFKSKFVIY